MKLFTRSLLAIIGVLCFSFSAFSQHPHRCLDDATLMNSLPQEVVDHVADVRNRTIQKNLAGPTSTNKQNCHQIYRIPVVFHVIHNRGVDSINAYQVHSAMQVLNEDFRKKTGTPGDGTGVDTQIEFYLATLDPLGAFTTGITYTDTSLADFSYTDANDTALKAVIKWPQQQYLNVWVVDTIKYMGSYLLGYAFGPSDGANILDGVVMADQYIGRDTGTARANPYNKGRTLTHEVGHYLGLLHPFEYVISPCEGDSAANCATSGDLVCDVPPHAAPNFSCNSVVNSCVEFPNDTTDFLNNYMEYVNDTCMDMFSQGQATLMQNAIDADSFRTIMTSTNNLMNTGIYYHGNPDAFFFAMPPGGCTGDSIQFFDQSLGVGPNPGIPLPDSRWAWSFPGGTPDTSNAQHPLIQYRQPGNYVASLTLMNGFGICSYIVPITINGAMLGAITDTVSQSNPTSFTSFADQPGTWSWNFGDGTGDSAATQANPKYVYPSHGFWIYTATFTPLDPLSCVARYTDTAFVTEFPLPIDLVSWAGRSLGDRQVELQWAMAPHSTAGYFEVESSTDGRYFKSVGFVQAAENPTSKKTYSLIDRNPADGQNHYRLRIVDKDGGEAYAEILQVEVVGNLTVQLYPNPTQNDFTLKAMGVREMEVSIRIYDLMGKTLQNIPTALRRGENELPLSLSEAEHGMYFLEIRDLVSGTIQFQGRISKLP